MHVPSFRTQYLSLVVLLTLVACKIPPPDGPQSNETTVTVDGIGLTATIGPLDSTVLGLQVTVAADEATSIDVVCVSPAEPGEQFEQNSPPGLTHTVQFFGLLAETEYQCEVSLASSAQALATDLPFLTESIPFSVPPVHVTDTDGRYGSYTLLNHWKKSVRNHRLLIYDSEGRIRWYWHSEATTGGLEATYLGDGLILTGGGTGVNPGKLSLEGEFVEQMPNAAVLLPSEPYHHEATLNPRGDLVGLGKTFIYWEGQPLEVFSLTAFDTISDAITFEWSAAEALDAGTFQLGQDLTDPFHANAIQWVTDDLGEAVWVNMKGMNTIARISPATGEVTHMLGAEHGFDLLDAQGLPLDDSEWFFGQHAPRFKDNQLLVFNNGMAGPLGQTSVELFEVNVSAHTLTRLWKYTRPGWYEPYFGEGDWLPNGNIMVVSGHCTGCVAKPGTSFVAEVNPDTNEVTWEMTFEESADSIYRAHMIDGCDLFHNKRYCDR